MVELRWQPAAAREAQAARPWYRVDQDAPDVARRFQTSLQRALVQIAQAPERWPILVDDLDAARTRHPHATRFAVAEEASRRRATNEHRIAPGSTLGSAALTSAWDEIRRCGLSGTQSRDGRTPKLSGLDDSRCESARPERFELPTFGSEDRVEPIHSALLASVVTGSYQVTVEDAARALLGMVARGETIPIATLEEFARKILDGERLAKLALQVLGEGEPHRLARAIELAGVVLDNGSLRVNKPSSHGSTGHR